jgi:hypothetical protein
VSSSSASRAAAWSSQTAVKWVVAGGRVVDGPPGVGVAVGVLDTVLGVGTDDAEGCQGEREGYRGHDVDRDPAAGVASLRDEGSEPVEVGWFVVG